MRAERGLSRRDPMLNGSWSKTQRMRRRIVVELEPEEFALLDAPADFLRLVALRLVAEGSA